jgi:uncharacterized protein YdeI (BOF family)
MRRSWRNGVAAAAIVAGLLLAGCSGSGDGGGDAGEAGGQATPSAEGGTSGAGSPIADAVEKTQQAGSARLASTSSTQVQGTTIETVSEGVYDFANQQGEMQVTMSGAAPLRTVVVDGVAYQEVPAEMASLLPGKRWLQVGGTAQPGAPGQPGADPLAGNPALMLGGLSSSSSVTEAGTEQVRGGDTATRYTTTMDLSGSPLATLVGDTLEAQVWIDEEGYLRQMTASPSVTVAGTTATSQFKTEFWDFGTAVNVTPPSPGEVATSEEFSNALSRSLQGGGG